MWPRWLCCGAFDLNIENFFYKYCFLLFMFSNLGNHYFVNASPAFMLSEEAEKQEKHLQNKVFHTQTNAYLDLPGAIWSSLELSEAIWSYLKPIWSYLELSSSAIFSYLELPGASSSYLQLSGGIWSNLQLFGL